MTNDAREFQLQHNRFGPKSHRLETKHQAFGILPSFRHKHDGLPVFYAGYTRVLSLDGRRAVQARVLSHKPYIIDYVDKRCSPMA